MAAPPPYSAPEGFNPMSGSVNSNAEQEIHLSAEEFRLLLDHVSGNVQSQTSGARSTVPQRPTITQHIYDCPTCHARVPQRRAIREYRVGFITWVNAALMALVSCGICCWVPFAMDETKDIHYYCPHCGELLQKKRCYFDFALAEHNDE